MRIVLGGALLRDLCIIASTLSGLLGDQSVLPPSIALSNYFEQNYRTIHILSGAQRWQVVMITLHIGLAIAYILGWKTKYITPILWFMTCSLQGANPLITNGGDSIIRLLLMWSIFLPIGSTRSIDALHQPSLKDYKISNIATFGLILQMAHIYFWSYFLKTDPIRRVDYTATYYALSLDPFVKQAGLLLYQFPALMKWLTMYTIKLELLGPLLYLIPNNYTKILACLAFIAFHLGLTATMYLGAFPRYAIAGWIGLMPGIVWENKLVKSIKSKVESRKSVSKNGQLTTDNGQPNSGQSTTSNNYLSRPSKIFLIFVIVYSFMRNLRTIDFNKRDDYFPTSVNRFGFIFRLDQYRAMFAPYPKIDDGRYNITGISQFDEKKINITHPDRPPFDSKPTHQEIVTIVPHEKWRKLVDNLRQRSNSQYRQYFAAYLCRTHNETATKYTRTKSINLTYMREDTLLDYKTGPITPVDLGTWECK